MNYRNFIFDDSKYLVCMEKKIYNRNGKRWASAPASVERSVVTAEFYQNYITTVAPFRTEKQVARFRFFYLPPMEKEAGWREKEILKNAVTWNEKVDGSRWLLTLYTNDDGVTASGVYDLNTDLWRG